MTAKDVTEILGVSKSKSYQIIKRLNAELVEKGYLVVDGKVPGAYLFMRFHIMLDKNG